MKSRSRPIESDQAFAISGTRVIDSILAPSRSEELIRRARWLSMKRPLMRTLEGWLLEIKLAIKDARETEPFSTLTGERITDANLFHLAPLVCLKFRGRKLLGREANRVRETALANYVVNSDPEEVDHGLESKPLLAFAVCYVTTHLALDLVDERRAQAILNDCEEHLEEGIMKFCERRPPGR